jgi:hypothetical protein
MKPTTRCAAFLLAITAFSGQAWARHGIYVDAGAAPNGDGTISAPFQTIAQAMERGREIRRENEHSRIVVHVAPGVYNENFPIYVNVSNLELRGSTRLREDDDSEDNDIEEDNGGLPANCGTDTDPAPCIEPGTETVITPTVPQGRRLFTVAPTKDSPADRLTDITISGFVFDGKASNPATAVDVAVFVDRVDRFSIHENVARRELVGVITRLSSGRIHKNFVYSCNGGIVAGAGSEIYPANIQITANRSINNLEAGALAVGAANVRAPVDPNLKEIQTLYDPAQHPEQVPDKLVVEVIGNDFSHSPRFGFRFEIYADDVFYNTTDNQPMTANITATLRDNACKENGEYGILVEGAFATRTNPRKFTSVFNGSFEDNDCSGAGRAGVFAGFMLNGVVTRNPGLIKTYKYQQDSQFTLQSDDLSLSSGLDYDNPFIDPFDRQTPLNNQLTVNGDMLTGTQVTCHPPGLPCPP